MNPQFKQRGSLNFRVLMTLGVVLVLIIGVAYFFYGLQPSSDIDAPREFKIAKGDSFRIIGAHLSRESFIKSISVFKLYAFITGKAQKFQPGVYEISSAMSVPQIADILTIGKRNDVFVTIPEGSTVKDIDAILSASGVLSENTITNYSLELFKADYPFLGQMNSLEGFLFPDSYYFEMGSSPQTVVRRILDNFMKKAWPLLSDSKNWYDTLTLASYLEREVPKFEERRIVAGILLKRLAIKMPLQVDATISYAKCGGRFRGCEGIKVMRDDLTFFSPFNTYERLGWTPTPISNPGAEAIKAALTPVQSQYFYYLSASSTKETFFSKTLDEHNRKRVKYL